MRSEFPALRDDDGQFRFVIRSRCHILYPSHSEHSIDDFPKDDVFIIEPFGLGAGDEKLAAVRIRT